MLASPGQQGILSVLEAECKTTKNKSLGKSLSADASSRKWSAEDGSSAIDSSSYSQDDGDEEDEQKRVPEGQGRADSNWSFLLTQQAELEEPNKSSLVYPYVHPLAKKPGSSMSGKSLQVCTESLCSETGSDKFSSSPPSESEYIIRDEAEELVEKHEMPRQNSDMDKACFEKYEIGIGNKRHSRTQSYPPPIPSLCYYQPGTSVHMNSRRNCGRLVLEAVSMSSPDNFRAQRGEGRLILAFSDHLGSKLGSTIEEEVGEESDEIVEELDEGFWDFVQNNEKEEEIGYDGEVEEHQQIETKTQSGQINCEPISVPQSLPSRPWAADMASRPPAPAAGAAASFGGYPMPREPPCMRNDNGNKRMCLELTHVFKGCGGCRSSVLFCRHGILTA